MVINVNKLENRKKIGIVTDGWDKTSKVMGPKNTDRNVDDHNNVGTFIHSELITYDVICVNTRAIKLLNFCFR